MTREEAINIVRNIYQTDTEKEALAVLIPELAESGDERIRKEIIEFIDWAELRGSVRNDWHQKKRPAEWIAYLEKQKEQKLESCDCSRDEESYINGIHHVLMNPEAYGLIKQKPAEWSEEDERNRDRAIFYTRFYQRNEGTTKGSEECIAWLKLLRNRVGKESLQPHWKPSEEQPEMDLEKFTEKMDAWKARYNYPNNIPIKAAMAFTARMFYQYPNVARQWYDSLPKATMD